MVQFILHIACVEKLAVCRLPEYRAHRPSCRQQNSYDQVVPTSMGLVHASNTHSALNVKLYRCT